MKRLVQFNISSRQRLQPVPFNEYLHGIDAFDSGYRIDERFELTILSEGPSGLPLEIFREVERCRRAVNARVKTRVPSGKRIACTSFGGPVIASTAAYNTTL